MKKIISLSLVLMLLLSILAVPAMAEEETIIGTLSYLNMTEEEEGSFGPAFRQVPMKLLVLHGVLTGDSDAQPFKRITYRHYDTLNALLLGLNSGDVKAISVPYYTAKYLCSTNDTLKLTREYHPENAAGLSDWALARLSDGYAFMLKKENTELRDEFDARITAMKEDGTLQKLIDEYIIKVADGGEPVAVDFETFEGDPIKVGVSGDLPPMDYVAADGTFAGFNTAVLAEIGRRLQKNIELVQVENVGRALALSEGKVDAVFWTRSISEGVAEERRVNGTSAGTGIESATEEERAILAGGTGHSPEALAIMDSRDMPPETIITQAYFSDFPILVVQK